MTRFLRLRSAIGTVSSNRRVIAVSTCALAFLMPVLTPADEAVEESTDTTRPRIGLVLGGGGARGAAHVGVLKVLEELRIPVDYIAGTSMGSIVGGLYASGMGPQQIEQEMLAMDWNDLFEDYPSREQRSFRRKQDDAYYAFKAKPGFNDGKIKVPLAFIRGQKFDLALSRLSLPMFEVKDFDRLPIPYRAVATDLETGKEVVLAEGSLGQAIRASMAVPAAFDPVEIDGRLLVDGGLANNVPVSVARDMGADVFIVVDVGSGLYRRDQITRALDVTRQLSNFLFTLNTEPQLKILGARDVLIRPQLGDIGGGSFERVAEAVPIGERAAREAIESLRRYSVTPEEYARFLARRESRQQDPPMVEFVRVENDSRLGDAVVAERISAEPGQPLDLERLETDIGQVYGLEVFASVRYDVVEEEDKTGLVIGAKEKFWGPGYLQFGAASSNDIDGDSIFKLGAIYTRTAINTLNGEWRIGGQLGDEPSFFAEIYQPLDPKSRYFVSAKGGYETSIVNTFDDAGNKLARFRLASYGLELAAGREFGTWGEGRIGYRRKTGTAELNIGAPVPDIDLDLGEVFLRLSDDKLDSLSFPRTGHRGLVEWRIARDGLGAQHDYDQVLLSYLQAYSWGANTLMGQVVGATTPDDDAPLESLFRLGGFLRLSGVGENELSGQHAGLAELMYMRRISDLQFLRTYLGASLELGKVWQTSSDASFDDTILAGSVFLGLDTPVGPLYVAYGRTELDDQSFYIYLGPRFSF
jgi:NTE family protein